VVVVVDLGDGGARGLGACAVGARDGCHGVFASLDDVLGEVATYATGGLGGVSGKEVVDWAVEERGRTPTMATFSMRLLATMMDGR
jgi:hypothetical protein